QEREVAPELLRLRQAAEALRLHVEQLDEEQLELILRHRLGVEALPRALVSLVAKRSEGNPFFAEQLILALRESHSIEIAVGVCPFAGEPAELRMPETLELAITSRVDRMSAIHQLTLKVASVIGWSFTQRLLAEIYPVQSDRPQLPRSMEHLTS